MTGIAHPRPAAESIAMSVVIPTYRRFELLRRCLLALCAQDFPPERFEIIVADDDACVERAELLRTWIAQEFPWLPGRPWVHYVAATCNQGPAGARNRGWRKARGEVIAFTDDDTIPDHAWLSRGWDAIARGWDAVAGAIQMPLSKKPTDYERNAAGLSRAEFATANCFVRRTALETIGGFDERFTAAWREDSDLQFSLLEAGFKCSFAADAIVVHPIRPAHWGVSLSQQRKIAFDALLFKKHARHYRERIQSAPPWHYYVIVAAAILACVALLARWPSVAMAAAALWAALTLRFCLQRLAGNSRAPRHVLEMLATSVLVPPLALFWRLHGAARYRVLFL